LVHECDPDQERAGRAARCDPLTGRGEREDLVNAEILDAIRQAERTGQVSAGRAAQAVVDLEDSPIERVATTSMAQAIWSLRHNLAASDACYVITARAFDVPPVTADLRLARAPKLGIRVIAV
jgi:predicted nucleic acid-binding protein